MDRTLFCQLLPFLKKKNKPKPNQQLLLLGLPETKSQTLEHLHFVRKGEIVRSIFSAVLRLRPGALIYRCPWPASYCRGRAIRRRGGTAPLCPREESRPGPAPCPCHGVGLLTQRGRTPASNFCRPGKKIQSTEQSDRGFVFFKNHNGFCKQLIKRKIYSLPPPPPPLFAKWCEVGCVNDSTLTSSPFRSLIMPWWCCSHCCSESQHFHYNFLFSGVFTVVIKIQSRLKLGIPGLLPGVISFCCI